MLNDIKKYFIPNTDATFITEKGNYCLESVDRVGNKRVPKACQQATLNPVDIKKVIEYISEFLRYLNEDAGKNDLNIVLDGAITERVGKGIVVRNCTWEPPIYDRKKRRYTFYDPKYDVIKDSFGLDYANDIIWIKFTKDGYLGVVADSFDINFDYDVTSGKLLRMISPEKEWDESFVVIFPITPQMKQHKTRKEIETGIGNFLVDEKLVPIIDYYSHNNFTY